ncbi:uncharacterized protein B0T15DRAFT_570193 [Chaetomium strumarium]|uniref:Uncharacterized protein n=1 Tax=Chaetomium strumarium TaxID=1170767 RepID=A0AAJ0H076_9PEZI|nr:hypothetical protein B0T15DRAFT_570193 [Chaetomium strumarium]
MFGVQLLSGLSNLSAVPLPKIVLFVLMTGQARSKLATCGPKFNWGAYVPQLSRAPLISAAALWRVSLVTVLSGPLAASQSANGERAFLDHSTHVSAEQAAESIVPDWANVDEKVVDPRRQKIIAAGIL